jgi:hypothetical protein
MIGTIVFTDNEVAIAGCEAVSVSSGLATCSVTYPLTGAHSIVAAYSGDSDDIASAAPAFSQAVQPDPTLTTVTSGPDPSTVGGLVTISVTVKAAAPGTGNPTGTVTIFVDGKVAATTLLDSTVDSLAIYATTNLSVGTHTITATYNGALNYNGSSSAASSDAQVVAAKVTVPETGGGSGRWAALAALSLILNGVVLLAWTRRRRRR